MSRVGDELLMILLVFFCVLLHEFGHAFMAQYYQVKTKDITLLPLGGVARLERMPEKPLQELLVALAGPLVNLIIIILLLPLILLGKGWPLAVDFEFMETNGLLVNLLIVNVSLLVFNLLPAFPMDGGRVLRSLLAMKFSRQLATKIAAYTGMAIAVLFVIVGLYFNLILSLIGVFVFLGAGSELKSLRSANHKFMTALDRIIRHDFILTEGQHTLEEVISRLLVTNASFVIVRRSDQEFAVLSTDDVFRCFWTIGDKSSLFDLPLIYEDSLNAKSSIETAEKRFRKTEAAALAIEENNAVSGIITRRDVALLISLTGRGVVS